MILRLDPGVGKDAVRRAYQGTAPTQIEYAGVLSPADVRAIVAGIRAAGTPRPARVLLDWMATHANAPEDVLRDLFQGADSELLMSLAHNRGLPRDLREALLVHPDEDVRTTANHVQTRLGLRLH